MLAFMMAFPSWLHVVSCLLLVGSAVSAVGACVLWRAANSGSVKALDAVFPRDPVTGKHQIDERILPMSGGSIMLGMGALGAAGCSAFLLVLDVFSILILPS
mmetsp:Transcript_1339/g.2736  ORF Transcript_1339/g.2736 Transcript_1339/m.2736 type:complete len:102 (-) Transcript_1339:370-675(-)